MKVCWTEVAAGDLESIVDFIAMDSERAAIAAARKIVEAAESLSKPPGRGRIVPELRSVATTSYRELIRQPWRIIYRSSPDAASVVAILDARRNVEDILLDRLTRGGL